MNIKHEKANFLHIIYCLWTIINISPLAFGFGFGFFWRYIYIYILYVWYFNLPYLFIFFLDVIIFVHILVYLVNYFYVWNSAHFINIDANFYILFWILFLNGHFNILFLFFFICQ